MVRVLCESILEHFNLIWEMHEEAIVNIPKEYWKEGDIEYLIPARQIFHVTESADYYSSIDQNSFLWGHRFGTRARDTMKKNLPNKEELFQYHNEVKEKIDSWLKTSSDIEILQYQNTFRWTGMTVLSRLIYVLAHYRQHFGEINAELRRRGLPRIKWRIFGD
jgi:uncharacterized damage-inducible protein DinB